LELTSIVVFELELEGSALHVEPRVSHRVPSLTVELRMHFTKVPPLAVVFELDLDFSRVPLRAIVSGLEADTVDPQLLKIVHFDCDPRFIVGRCEPFVVTFVTLAKQILRIFASGSATTWRSVFGLDGCLRANL
jgi:hypothetical protein